MQTPQILKLVTRLALDFWRERTVVAVALEGQ